MEGESNESWLKKKKPSTAPWNPSAEIYIHPTGLQYDCALTKSFTLPDVHIPGFTEVWHRSGICIGCVLLVHTHPCFTQKEQIKSKYVSHVIVLTNFDQITVEKWLVVLYSVRQNLRSYFMMTCQNKNRKERNVTTTFCQQ